MKKIFPIEMTKEQRSDLNKQAMRHGYMNLSAYMRDKSMGLLESDTIKTLQAKNKNLMKMIKSQEG